MTDSLISVLLIYRTVGYSCTHLATRRYCCSGYTGSGCATRKFFKHFKIMWQSSILHISLCTIIDCDLYQMECIFLYTRKEYLRSYPGIENLILLMLSYPGRQITSSCEIASKRIHGLLEAYFEINKLINKLIKNSGEQEK